MDNKRWTLVTGVLLLAGIITSVIFLQQRNEARQSWRESRDQIEVLKQRNMELNESSENQKTSLNVKADLIEKRQAAFTAAEIRITELKAQLDEKQTELDSVLTELQQVNGESERLERELASAEERIAGLASERNRLEEGRSDLLSRIEGMEGEDAKKTNTITVLEQHAGEKDDKIKSLNMKIQTLNDEMAVRKTQFAESHDLLLESKAEVDKLKKDLAAEKESADELEARLKEMSAERDVLNVQATGLKTESSDLRERIAEMETRHREELIDRNEKITALSSSLKVSGERLDDLEKDKGILVAKLKEANRTIIGLRDQLQEVITQVPALKDRLEQSMEKYQAIRENLTEAKAQQEKLEAQQKAMRGTYKALMAGLKQQLDSQEATIEEYREKLKITFVDRILFGFSQVRISPEGKAVLDQLAGVLANIPEGRINVIGHADSIPVASKFRYRFPSNWELSSARAAAVGRYLLKQGDLEPSRIAVTGLSRYQPIADNDTKEGRAKNRRVEIIITPEGYPNTESQ